MSVTYRSHTADLRMVIDDQALQGLFSQGVIGMSNVLRESFCDQQNQLDKRMIIEVEAADCTNLLIDFLSDVLSCSYIEKVVYCHLNIIEFSEHNIKAELSGASVEQFDEEIKAVTYHEADIVKNDKGFWTTCVIFDI